MTAEYDVILTGLLNAHCALKFFSYRVRSSSSLSHWFDNECSDLKIKTRSLERCYRRTGDFTDKRLWEKSMLSMHSLLNDKRSAATIAEIKLMKDNPRALWNKLDKARGVGVKRPVEAHTANEFDAFFESKLDIIRAATAGVPSPSLVSMHGCVMNDFTEVTSG